MYVLKWSYCMRCVWRRNNITHIVCRKIFCMYCAWHKWIIWREATHIVCVSIVYTYIHGRLFTRNRVALHTIFCLCREMKSRILNNVYPKFELDCHVLIVIQSLIKSESWISKRMKRAEKWITSFNKTVIISSMVHPKNQTKSNCMPECNNFVNNYF